MQEVWDAVEATLGSAVDDLRRVMGGDINDAWAVGLADGRRVFVKTNPRAAATMFPAEARGLAWLAEAAVIRVPKVLAAHERFLALELIVPSSRPPGFDEELGRGLAALHRSDPGTFGLDHDNFIGRLPQSNTPAPTWAEFFRRERLEPQLRMATEKGLASPRMREGFDALFSLLEERVGPPEPPARLHGDLWGGNLHSGEAGEPVLIDPAVYGGHREMDLAMMRLFGGFGRRVFDAYQEAWPLSPGHEERVPLYQLYPLMVHVNLFGGGYVGSVERALATVV